MNVTHQTQFINSIEKQHHCTPCAFFTSTQSSTIQLQKKINPNKARYIDINYQNEHYFTVVLVSYHVTAAGGKRLCEVRPDPAHSRDASLGI